jgi:hypothetical protein
MDDRQTPRLYLELGDGAIEAGARRGAELAGHAGVQRVSWWENCAPGRTDLPMRVTDGSMLWVAELDDGSTAPDQPPDTTAHCFRRHPRPSQGVLTGRATTGLLVVWISPRHPDLSASLRDWGDFVHIRHIAAAGIPGFTQISVFENESSEAPLYMHLYEFDSPDPEATYSTMVDFVAPRLGGIASESFTTWADWREPGGQLFYCNTFRLIGDAT